MSFLVTRIPSRGVRISTSLPHSLSPWSTVSDCERDIKWPPSKDQLRVTDNTNQRLSLVRGLAVVAAASQSEKTICAQRVARIHATLRTSRARDRINKNQL